MLPGFATRFMKGKFATVKPKTATGSKRLVLTRSKPVKPLINSRSILTRNNLPPNVLAAQYAVRGPLVVRAVEIEKALKKGEKFPFSRITYCNVRYFHSIRLTHASSS
jgi:hypothetical protein